MDKILLNLIQEVELLVKRNGVTLENLDLVFCLRLLVNSSIRAGEWEPDSTSLILGEMVKLSSSLTELPSVERIEEHAQSYSTRVRSSC
jgi:carbonic anhydrase/acetyltransferase-like protein (isoleucine patch superfamily)